MNHIFHYTDLKLVITVNLFAFMLSLSDKVEFLFRMLLLLLTIGYTAWKWYTDFIEKRKAKKRK